jgi:hypothetical protein
MACVTPQDCGTAHQGVRCALGLVRQEHAEDRFALGVLGVLLLDRRIRREVALHEGRRHEVTLLDATVLRRGGEGAQLRTCGLMHGPVFLAVGAARRQSQEQKLREGDEGSAAAMSHVGILS